MKLPNIKKISFRNKTETTVDVAEMWLVRWDSRHGEFLSDYKPEVRGFTSKEDAEEFADALKDAFKLLKYTGSITNIFVEPQKL